MDFSLCNDAFSYAAAVVPEGQMPCYRCGRRGNNSSQCYARFHISGAPLQELQEEAVEQMHDATGCAGGNSRSARPDPRSGVRGHAGVVP